MNQVSDIYISNEAGEYSTEYFFFQPKPVDSFFLNKRKIHFLQ